MIKISWYFSGTRKISCSLLYATFRAEIRHTGTKTRNSEYAKFPLNRSVTPLCPIVPLPVYPWCIMPIGTNAIFHRPAHASRTPPCQWACRDYLTSWELRPAILRQRQRFRRISLVAANPMFITHNGVCSALFYTIPQCFSSSWMENLRAIFFCNCFATAKIFSPINSVTYATSTIINSLNNRLVGDESWAANESFSNILTRDAPRTLLCHRSRRSMLLSREPSVTATYHNIVISTRNIVLINERAIRINIATFL